MIDVYKTNTAYRKTGILQPAKRSEDQTGSSGTRASPLS